MPSADQVSVNSTHSTMRWPWWVVLIAGSTGSALRAGRPPNRSHHAGCCDVISFTPPCDGFLCSMLTLRHHRPGHTSDLVGERAGSDLGRPPRQQCREPWPMPRTMELRIADHGESTGGEKAA